MAQPLCTCDFALKVRGKSSSVVALATRRAERDFFAPAADLPAKMSMIPVWPD